MIEVLNKDGRRVRTSGNLRGLLTHIRAHSVESVQLIHSVNDTGTLRVYFHNGDSCQTFSQVTPLCAIGYVFASICTWYRATQLELL